MNEEHPTMNLRPSRRTVLKTGAAAAGLAAAATAAPGWVRPERAGAAPRGRLVYVFLRGGQDHLSTVVPYTERAYYDARPTIAIPAASVLQLYERFGLHPSMTGLHALHRAGRLGVVVGAGNLAGNRSHFTAQDLCEYGTTTRPADAKGWLARYLSSTATANDSLFRGVAMTGTVPMSLRGSNALGIQGIRGFGLNAATRPIASLIHDQYGGSAPVERTGIRALDASSRISTLTGSTAADPTTRAFADLAILLASNLGVEVATVDITGWDTHHDMGTATAGWMRDLLAGLDGYLAGFQADLDARGLADVTTVVMTEFGRRVEENGSGGTDHGYGSAMLVMGARVIPGVHGEWAGLASSVIGNRGDVVPATDFRDVLGDCVRGVLGIADPSTVFPGHPYRSAGVITP
jgi:uncharacterized protein (DUF1501 family)